MARAWHACEVATGRTTVVAVGDLEPERFGERLAGIFARGAARDIVGAAGFGPAFESAARPARIVVERAKRQTALAMLFPGPSRADPTRFTAEVWAAMASGLGGRLFAALRERRSLAYTVIASSWQRVGTGGLLLYLATSPEREDEAREALLGELAQFREDVPEAAEVGRAVNYLAGQAQVQRQTAATLAGEIADAWLLGSGLEELGDPTAGFRRVTASAVRDLAARHLDPAMLAEGVVRGSRGS
jgi:zinc protease